MRFLSLCSGIEAASVAFGPLGWTPTAFSEIEPFPSAVLAHHYPDTPNLGDMTAYASWPEAVFADTDIVVGGPPCQAFSVAGQRKGLDDARGNLTLTYANLIDHADTVRAAHGRPPVLALYENVPGILSDKTNAFGCLLAALAGEDEALVVPRWPRAGVVDGRRRRVAWCTLDAQFFGLAQRRRRVFVLAVSRELVERLGDRADPAGVLAIGAGLRRDTPSRRGAGEDVAGSTGDGLARCITAGEMKRRDWETRNFVAFHHNAQAAQLPSAARDTSVTDALTCSQQAAVAFGTDTYSGTITGDVAATLSTRSGNGTSAGPTVLAFSAKDHGADASHDVAPTMRAMGHAGSHANGGGQLAVLQGMRVRRLTPVECERLQGFPDGYTAVPYRNKPAENCPNGPRYKALGNSWAVPCVRWIGERVATAIDGSFAVATLPPSSTTPEPQESIDVSIAITFQFSSVAEAAALFAKLNGNEIGAITAGPAPVAADPLPVDIAYALSPDHSAALRRDEAAVAHVDPPAPTPAATEAAPRARGRRTAEAGAETAAPAKTADAPSPTAASAEAQPPVSTAADPAPAPKAITYEDLRQAVFKLAAKSHAAAKAVNASFGVGSMKELDPSRWVEAYEAVTKKLAEV